MAWPGDPGYSALASDKLDAGTKSAKDARPQLFALKQRFDSLSSLVTAMTQNVPLLLSTAGQVMTQLFKLSADGTDPMHPVTKQQLDAVLALLAPALAKTTTSQSVTSTSYTVKFASGQSYSAIPNFSFAPATGNFSCSAGTSTAIRVKIVIWVTNGDTSGKTVKLASVINSTLTDLAGTTSSVPAGTTVALTWSGVWTFPGTGGLDSLRLVITSGTSTSVSISSVQIVFYP